MKAYLISVRPVQYFLAPMEQSHCLVQKAIKACMLVLRRFGLSICVHVQFKNISVEYVTLLWIRSV